MDQNFDFLALLLINYFSDITEQFLHLEGVSTVHYEAEFWRLGKGFKFWFTELGLWTIGLDALSEESTEYINVFVHSINEQANIVVERFGSTCYILYQIAKTIPIQ